MRRHTVAHVVGECAKFSNRIIIYQIFHQNISPLYITLSSITRSRIGRPSVRLSVCLSHPAAACRCSGFAAVGPAGSRYRPTAAAAGHGTQQQTALARRPRDSDRELSNGNRVICIRSRYWETDGASLNNHQSVSRSPQPEWMRTFSVGDEK